VSQQQKCTIIFSSWYLCYCFCHSSLALNIFVHLLWSITGFYVQSFISLSTISSHVFLGLSFCPTEKHNTFSTPSLSSFLKTCPYRRHQFLWTTFLCLPFLNAALIQCKIVYPFHTKHPPNHSHFCPMQCHFIFSFQWPHLTSV